jgi:DNA-directed RNA polymerase specialized sigma24 family protein
MLFQTLTYSFRAIRLRWRSPRLFASAKSVREGAIDGLDQRSGLNLGQIVRRTVRGTWAGNPKNQVDDEAYAIAILHCVAHYDEILAADKPEAFVKTLVRNRLSNFKRDTFARARREVLLYDNLPTQDDEESSDKFEEQLSRVARAHWYWHVEETRKDLCEWVQWSLTQLDESESEVIRLEFGFRDDVEYSLTQIAEMLACSLYKVKKLKAEAMDKLRRLILTDQPVGA